MLSVLRIQNLAIVEALELELAPGMNVLTGETGAGKSIVLRAMELLTGKRASADLVRTGADQCVVEGLFVLGERKAPLDGDEDTDEIAELLAEDELLVRRTIDRTGKSKITVNGRLVTAAMLQLLAPRLLDITGQHQQQTLLDAAHHRAVLDEFGVPEELRATTHEAFREFSSAKQKLDSFLKDQGERKEYFRRIGFEREELAGAELRVGKREALELEMKRLASVETISASLNRCSEIIESGDNPIEAQLRALSSTMEQLCAIDPALSETAQLVESASVQLGEARLALDEYASRLEVDPDRLESLREQVAEIARLERKYGRKEEDLVAYLGAIELEMRAYESGELDESALRKRLEEKEAVLRTAEERLTAARVKAGGQLSKQVKAALKPLGMKHADFIVERSPAPSSIHGADDIEFLLSANPGEPARGLAKVASGGELSRILLVLKTILNERTGALTQIFDEVDTGIGGAVAQIVGEKLRAVAKFAQVVLVTHSPQIAAFADRHFFISKAVSGSRTSTSLTVLDEDATVKQIASMLAGKNVSSNFEQSARELLALKK